jgi:hypothetical protein
MNVKGRVAFSVGSILNEHLSGLDSVSVAL